MVQSLACANGSHNGCGFAQDCECICHRKDQQPAEVVAFSLTFDLRWEAHQAVKKFDLKPGLANAEAAAAALTKYVEHLKGSE